MIKSIDITLYDKTESGVDDFNQPVYTESEIVVKDVLVSPVTSEAIIDELSLTGKKIVYELALPKKDTHTWEDRKVSFFGELWHTVGIPTEGIAENIPLRWNKKIKVERYE